MSPSSVAVPVWYEPASPPTPYPLLASETDIPDLCFDVQPLSHQEVAIPKGLAAPTRTPKSRTIAFGVPRSTTPEEDATGDATPTPERGSITDSNSDSTASTESETESQDDADMKIAKPAGEVGRPGRGGYSLEQVLDWNPRRMSEFKVRRVLGSVGTRTHASREENDQQACGRMSRPHAVCVWSVPESHRHVA